MSAWVCSDEHISYLVSAAKDFDPYGETPSDPTDLGRTLLRENVRSVLFRYDEETLYAGEVQAYADQIKNFTYRQVPVTAVEALKLLASWQYQTCETSDHETTEAWMMSERIRDLCISALPGYDDAPWSV